MEITFDDVERWANSDELDERFEQLFEEIQDFGDIILALCDDSTLLRLAANRDSPRRQFFAYGLVERLVPALYNDHGLPYEFSRFSGMISFENYKSQELVRLERVYEACKIVEAMRTSQQDEIKNIGNMILDYRHDRLMPNAKAGKTKLMKLLDYQLQQSFRPNVSTYTMRNCQRCNQGYKSWMESGVEISPDQCPSCKMKSS